MIRAGYWIIRIGYWAAKGLFLKKKGGGGGRVFLRGLKINPKSPCKMYK
jgi:hypothetical protein